MRVKEPFDVGHLEQLARALPSDMNTLMALRELDESSLDTLPEGEAFAARAYRGCVRV